MYFDKTILYTDKDLQNDKHFWAQHSSFISRNRRGYGYWLWKSYLIQKTMATMEDEDILMYLDSGCEIGGDKQSLIPDFFEYVKQDKIIGTTTSSINLERDWNKMDTIMHFDMQDSPLLHTHQHQGGVLLLYVCNEVKNIIDLWYTTACNYHLIDDSPSKNPNLKCFKEHRHDQSIFSLITKKYGPFSKRTLFDVIYVNRNRTGISRI